VIEQRSEIEVQDAATEASTDSHNSQWIYVDLQGTYPLRQFRMQWTLGHHARVYGVYVYRAGCGWCLIGRTTTGDGDDVLTLSNPVLARYVLLGLSYPAMPSGSYQLLEWQVFGSTSAPPPPPPSESNVALGRPATASSQQPGFEAGRATDGEDGTAWRSNGKPAWIYVDFGTVRTVTRSILEWEPGAHASRYALYAWTGYGWRAVYATSTGDGGVDAIGLPTLQTRYLLLYGIEGPAAHFGLSEFEVYGFSGGTPYPLEGDIRIDEDMWSSAAGEAPLLKGLPAIDAKAETLESAPSANEELPEVDAPPADGFPNPS
jgi:hypothetical protein